MRSGIPLSTIRSEVMIEAGLSEQGGHAIYNVKKLNQMINRTERLLLVGDEWPDQHIERQVTVLADAQYVDLPSDLSFTEIESSHVSFGSEWLQVSFGIGARERTIYNTTERATPIMRLEATKDQPGKLEVWPIGSVDQILLFQGTKSVGTMVNEDDVCALDADVIVFKVAAEILGRDNQADARLKLDMATDHMNKIMKKQGSTKREPINLGRRKPRVLRPGIDYIAPGGG